MRKKHCFIQHDKANIARMPKLLTAPKKKSPMPRCGRRIEYNAPTSPWQKLVDGERQKLGLSFADLANAMADGNRGTIWIWVHNKQGYPSPQSFTLARAAALYKTLKIDPKVGATALDASRHLYTAREIPQPFETREAFEQFIETLEAIKPARVLKETILNIARRIHAGLTPANPGDPEYPDSSPAPRPVPRAPKGRKRL
jgi:hypothetical protein